MVKPELERCVNCHSNIGALEKAMLWNESVVCVTCFQKLNQTTPLVTPTSSLRSASGPKGMPAIFPAHSPKVFDDQCPPRLPVQKSEGIRKFWNYLIRVGLVIVGWGILTIINGAARDSAALMDFGWILCIFGSGAAGICGIGAWRLYKKEKNENGP